MKKKRIFASLSAVLLSAATLHAFPVFAAGDTTVHLVTNGSLPYFTGAAVDLSDPNNAICTLSCSIPVGICFSIASALGFLLFREMV